MNLQSEILSLLDSTLSLRGRAKRMQLSDPLLGALPEFDSMAVLGILLALEERFSLVLEEEEITAAPFATLGSLCSFVEGKLSEQIR